LTDNSLQSAHKDQQEMRAVAEKPHDAVVKFDTYRNVQWHRAVLHVIAQHLVLNDTHSINPHLTHLLTFLLQIDFL